MRVTSDAVEAVKSVFVRLYGTIAEGIGEYSREIASAKEIVVGLRDDVVDKRRKLDAILDNRKDKRAGMENDLVSVSSEEAYLGREEGESDKLRNGIDGLDDFCQELTRMLSSIDETRDYVDKGIERADELCMEISRLLNALGESFGARVALVDACAGCLAEYENARRFCL